MFTAAPRIMETSWQKQEHKDLDVVYMSERISPHLGVRQVQGL